MAKNVHSSMRNCRSALSAEENKYKFNLYLDYNYPQPSNNDQDIKKMKNNDQYRCLRQRESFKKFIEKKEKKEITLIKLNRKFKECLFGEKHAYV